MSLLLDCVLTHGRTIAQGPKRTSQEVQIYTRMSPSFVPNIPVDYSTCLIRGCPCRQLRLGR